MIATNEELALLEKWKRKLCLARALTEGDSDDEA